MEIRPSRIEDAEQIADCVAAVARERRWLLSVEGFGVEKTRAFLEQLHETGGIQHIALAGGRVVGWCDVSPCPFEGMAHVGGLGMGLRLPYRGKGLGRTLLRSVVDEAFRHGLTRIELEVFSDNEAAIRLYRGQGFVLEGRRRSAWNLDGRVADLLLFGLLKPERPS